MIKKTITSQSTSLFVYNPSTQWKEILTNVTLFSFFSFQNFLTVKNYTDYKIVMKRHFLSLLFSLSLFFSPSKNKKRKDKNTRSSVSLKKVDQNFIN